MELQEKKIILQQYLFDEIYMQFHKCVLCTISFVVLSSYSGYVPVEESPDMDLVLIQSQTSMVLTPGNLTKA